MHKLVNQSVMKSLDQDTIEKRGMPQLVLMERAALTVKDYITSLDDSIHSCLILCGVGNNGADGVALGRLLNQANIHTDLFLCSYESDKYSEALKEQLDIYKSYSYPITHFLTDQYDLIIDGIFGIGLSRDITGEFRNYIEIVNGFNGRKLALDIPSGLDANNGQIHGIAFRADHTVTFGYEKVGLHLWPGCDYVGTISVGEIGIVEEPDDFIRRLQDCDMENLPPRKPHSNKGTYGKLMVIAGSKGMSGAAYLSAKAAFRSGCGLVKIYTVEENREVLQKLLPEAIISIYSEEDSKDKFFRQLDWADALVIGPGIGTNATGHLALNYTLDYLSGHERPTVIDADAINLISMDENNQFEFNRSMIFTPHLGEASRLFSKTVKEIQADLLENAKNFALSHHTNIILKDFRSVFSNCYGDLYLNFSGNSGMATAGSGDVLSGITGALLAQGMDASIAGAYSAYIHGKGGEEASKIMGEDAVMAEDIINGISSYIKRIREASLT